MNSIKAGLLIPWTYYSLSREECSSGDTDLIGGRRVRMKIISSLQPSVSEGDGGRFIPEPSEFTIIQRPAVPAG